MSRLLDWITRLYAALLRLYPLSFRDEFAAEMQQTFSQVLAEAAARGKAALGAVCWQELRQAPANIVREHWQERSRRTMELRREDSPAFERISGPGLLAALTPFLLIGLLELGPFLPPAAVYGLLGGTLVLMLAGLIRGLPGWSLPTAGFFAGIVALVCLSPWVWLLGFVPPLGDWLRLVLASGMPGAALFLVTLIGLVILARVKPLRPFYERLRRDWTRLAFALYGSAALWLAVTFDEYAGRQPYVFAASATLVAGALIYLWVRRPWPRFWALAVSLGLVLLIVAGSKWILIPSQTWPFPITAELREGELKSTLESGAWMILAVLGLPALLNLMPHTSQPAQAS